MACVLVMDILSLSLSPASSNLQSRLGQYADILREEARGRVNVQVKQRLRQLVSNLVNQGIYNRDIIHG